MLTTPPLIPLSLHLCLFPPLLQLNPLHSCSLSFLCWISFHFLYILIFHCLSLSSPFHNRTWNWISLLKIKNLIIKVMYEYWGYLKIIMTSLSSCAEYSKCILFLFLMTMSHHYWIIEGCSYRRMESSVLLDCGGIERDLRHAFPSTLGASTGSFSWRSFTFHLVIICNSLSDLCAWSSGHCSTSTFLSSVP